MPRLSIQVRNMVRDALLDKLEIMKSGMATSSGIGGGRQQRQGRSTLLDELNPGRELLADRQQIQVFPIVLSGGNVTALDPPEMKVEVHPVIGKYRGERYELSKPVIVSINDDGTTQLWYVGLDGSNFVRVLNYLPQDFFPLAKIPIPEPGTTSRIQDNRDATTVDGWIELVTDETFFNDFRADDRSIAKLRNVLLGMDGVVFTGEFTATENAQIHSALGTMLLDSVGFRFFDSALKLLLRQTGKGLYFYLNETEVSRFTNTDARVGQIQIEGNRLKSVDYIEKQQGFAIYDTGDADLNDIRARGQILNKVDSGSGPERFGYVVRAHHAYLDEISDEDTIYFADLTDTQTGRLLEPFDTRPNIRIPQYAVRYNNGTQFQAIMQGWRGSIIVEDTDSEITQPDLLLSPNNNDQIETEDAYDEFKKIYDPTLGGTPDFWQFYYETGYMPDRGLGHNYWILIELTGDAPVVRARDGDFQVVQLDLAYRWGDLGPGVGGDMKSLQVWENTEYYYCNGGSPRFFGLFPYCYIPISAFWPNEPTALDIKVDFLGQSNLYEQTGSEDTSLSNFKISKITRIGFWDWAFYTNRNSEAVIMTQNLHW